MKKVIPTLSCVISSALIMTTFSGCNVTSIPEANSMTKAETDAVEEAEAKSVKTVDAIFFGNDLQPFTETGKEQEMLDTLWIYYSDGSFEQFSEVDDGLKLFSTGSYAFENEGNFIYDDDEADHGDITITRTKKYQPGTGLENYDSTHTYKLGTLGFDNLYVSEDGGKQVKVLYYGNDKQPYVNTDGSNEMIDTEWIYYTDGTFEQYAEVNDRIVLFSTGTYELAEGDDFVYEDGKENQCTITINRDKKYRAGKGLEEYTSSHTYDLGTLGFDQVLLID